MTRSWPPCTSWAWRWSFGSSATSRAVAGAIAGRPGERLIELPALILAKLALMRRMHETGTTKVELARLLGVSEGAVRRLLRFDHRSHIDRIEAALRRLGGRLELRLRPAA